MATPGKPTATASSRLREALFGSSGSMYLNLVKKRRRSRKRLHRGRDGPSVLGLCSLAMVPLDGSGQPGPHGAHLERRPTHRVLSIKVDGTYVPVNDAEPDAPPCCERTLVPRP